ncbi:MAG: hypothetical protein A2V67_15550 [Deltaproteobacteria bacterium RBG_13_61_14]|nr:MAG: hypothetical protein A2V67_15550 [Deltaproteobacteria bacterium RBG_13_61_14]
MWSAKQDERASGKTAEEVGRSRAVKDQARDFGLGLSLFLSLLAGLAFFRGREHLVTPLLLAAALVSGLALVWPVPLMPWQRLAWHLAQALGWLNTRIMLGMVFYLVFTPTAWLLRLLGKDLMDRTWRPERSSYWRDRSEEDYDPAQDEKQF